ncbi:unnamed protein product [Absidia cylindrospora]
MLLELGQRIEGRICISVKKKTMILCYAVTIVVDDMKSIEEKQIGVVVKCLNNNMAYGQHFIEKQVQKQKVDQYVMDHSIRQHFLGGLSEFIKLAFLSCLNSDTGYGLKASHSYFLEILTSETISPNRCGVLPFFGILQVRSLDVILGTCNIWW